LTVNTSQKLSLAFNRKIEALLIPVNAKIYKKIIYANATRDLLLTIDPFKIKDSIQIKNAEAMIE
jgi:hypothetical protein